MHADLAVGLRCQRRMLEGMRKTQPLTQQQGQGEEKFMT